MADTPLVARAPLAHLAGPSRIGNLDANPGVMLKVETGLSLLLLVAAQGQSTAMRRAAQSVGIALPVVPGAALRGDGVVLWSGPDQWLATARSATAGLGLAVDQSDARVVLTLAGPKARGVLAKGCGVDLHPRVFQPGDTAMTPLFGVAAQIWQMNEAPTYGLAILRSYAETLWRWLTIASAEYGLKVVG